LGRWEYGALQRRATPEECGGFQVRLGMNERWRSRGECWQWKGGVAILDKGAVAKDLC
jgi:hypothetical protein